MRGRRLELKRIDITKLLEILEQTVENKETKKGEITELNS